VAAVGGGWYESEHFPQLELGSSDYSNSVTGIQKDYMVIEFYDSD
jgi:hypothetical protein